MFSRIIARAIRSSSLQVVILFCKWGMQDGIFLPFHKLQTLHVCFGSIVCLMSEVCMPHQNQNSKHLMSPKKSYDMAWWNLSNLLSRHMTSTLCQTDTLGPLSAGSAKVCQKAIDEGGSPEAYDFILPSLARRDCLCEDCVWNCKTEQSRECVLFQDIRTGSPTDATQKETGTPDLFIPGIQEGYEGCGARESPPQCIIWNYLKHLKSMVMSAVKLYIVDLWDWFSFNVVCCPFNLTFQPRHYFNAFKPC